MVYRNRGGSCDGGMACWFYGNGNSDCKLTDRDFQQYADSDNFTGNMRNLYNGMVSDRISQPGKKNQGRYVLEKQFA